MESCQIFVLTTSNFSSNHQNLLFKSWPTWNSRKTWHIVNQAPVLVLDFSVGYSDYDVFLEKVHGYIGLESYLFEDIFVKHVFQNFEPFLANRALKFQKMLAWPKNFFFTKFKYGYQNNSVFYVDFETVEKNANNLLTKKLQAKEVCKIWVCPLLYY